MELIIPANVGTEGKLFGSVGPIDIEGAFEKVGVEVARSEIRMPEGPIHEVGDYQLGAAFAYRRRRGVHAQGRRLRSSCSVLP